MEPNRLGAMNEKGKEVLFLERGDNNELLFPEGLIISARDSPDLAVAREGISPFSTTIDTDAAFLTASYWQKSPFVGTR
jgi:hypothetical protein